MNILDSLLYRFFGGKISYSQCGEDLIVEHYYRNKGKSKINYLDIGANHPKICNNTYLFYSHGSSGVNIEPNPQMHNLLVSDRGGDTNLNIGVSVGESNEFDYYQLAPHTLSTFNKEDAEMLINRKEAQLINVLKVKTKNINQLVKEYFKDGIDLISIDVEGWNLDIVKSIDFKICNPSMFVIETEEYLKDKSENERIQDIMAQNHYILYAKTNLNSIFIKT